MRNTLSIIRMALSRESPKGRRQAKNVEQVRELLEAYQQQLSDQYRREIEARQTEVAALQSQINPHFLYNTLEAIRGKALLEGAQETSDMVEALSRLFRYSISLPGQFVTLEQELENLGDYMKIQEYRFGKKISFQKDIEANDALLSYELPKLTLQPIVENAIFHGLERKLGAGLIQLTIFTTQCHLIIRVSDDGVGMSDETLQRVQSRLSGGAPRPGSSKSIALSNVNERIRLRFGREYGLSVSSTLYVGTDVELFLPWRWDDRPC
jgi:two-component system sensor histidine kinase YesM